MSYNNDNISMWEGLDLISIQILLINKKNKKKNKDYYYN
jgi:hypothetical protein